MWVYLVAFSLAFWPVRAADVRALTERSAIAEDIAETDASPEEALILMNLAALESNFHRNAKGRGGERGAFQILPPAKDYGAKEALRRLRTQGIRGYCGCARPCPKTIAYRTEPAKLWRWAFDPPPNESARSDRRIRPFDRALSQLDRRHL